MSVKSLLQICKLACEALTPFVRLVYKLNKKDSSKVAEVKADKTAFTIADGIVQHTLISILFLQETNPKAFAGIVGEEKNIVNITKPPFKVDDLVVPTELETAIGEAREALMKLAGETRVIIEKNKEFYKNLTLFIDPIDGTKQFVNGQGEMCSMMIGFARENRPVGGIIYRPLSEEPTYALGCASEKFLEMSLESPSLDVKTKPEDTIIMLRSKSSKSVFLDATCEEMGAHLVRVSGAGNKFLKIVEYSEKFGGRVQYVQDRGISRWDSCAGEAILEAYGGKMFKLPPFLKAKELPDLKAKSNHYSYRKVGEDDVIEEDIDLDFAITLTKTNVKDVKGLEAIPEKDRTLTKDKIKLLKPYGNLLGIVATNKPTEEWLKQLTVVLKKANEKSPPALT